MHASLLQVVGFFFGLLLIAAALGDALRTAVTVMVGGGGPLTTRLARGLWQAALAWHRRRKSHRLLAEMGTVILLSTIVLWILFLWGGCVLLFTAAPEAVVNAQTKAPASFWERVYFVGFTVSTLGVGDFVPQGAFWQAITVLASLGGLFLMTLSITYLISVLSAVAAKRQLAATIADLGLTPDEILRSGWDGESLSSLEQPLTQLTPMIEMHAQRHLAYPVMHFYHSPQKRTAVGLRIAALNEALRLMQHLPAEVQPPPAATRTVRRAIDGFLGTLQTAFMQSAEGVPLPPPNSEAVETLREAGLPMREASGESLQEDAALSPEQRRRLLRALVEDNGWRWSDAMRRDTASP